MGELTAAPGLLTDDSAEAVAGKFLVDAGKAMLAVAERNSATLRAGLDQIHGYQSLLSGIEIALGNFAARSILLGLAKAGVRDLEDTAKNYRIMINSLYTTTWEDYLWSEFEEFGRIHDVAARRVDFAREVISRFEQDRSLLSSFFGFPRDSTIVDVRFAGDAHTGGFATILHLSGGYKILYKPGDGAHARFFGAACDLVNDAVGVRLSVPDTLKGVSGDYHWQRYVTAKDDSSGRMHTVAVQRDLGGLLALAVGTGTVDLHHENVIVTADGVAVVDTECVMSPRLTPTEDAKVAFRFTRSTPEGIGILPLPISYGDWREKVDWGVLANRRQQALMPGWAQHVILNDGLPSVHLGLPAEDPPERDGPLPERVHLNEELRDAHIDGFEAVGTYLANSVVQDNMLDLATESEPRIRLLNRATQQYVNCIRRSTYPRYMRSTASRQRAIESWLAVDAGRREPALLESEVEQLVNLDVPLFEVDFESESILGASVESPRQVLERSMATMDDQGWRIRDKLAVRQSLETLAEDPQTMPLVDHTSPLGSSLAGGSSAPSQILAEIAERICSHANLDSPAGVWRNLALNSEGDWVVAGSQFSLYHGDPGIYFALKSLELSNALMPSVVNKIIDDLRERLMESLESIEESMFPVGLYEGMTGVAYALMYGASGSEQEQISTRMMEHLERISDWQSHDLISGVAGVAKFASECGRLGLGAPVAERLLERLASVIVKQARIDPQGLTTWEESDDWLGGLAHGPAAISWAFASEPNASRYIGLCQDAWRSQESLWEPLKQQWRRSVEGASSPMCAWCYGSEGLVAMDRDLHDKGSSWGLTEGFSRELVTQVRRAPLPADPSLCHGFAGRLLTVGQVGPAEAKDEISTRLLDYLRILSASEWLDDSLLLGSAGVLLTGVKVFLSPDTPNPLLCEIALGS